jgi:hypothetical protein
VSISLLIIGVIAAVLGGVLLYGSLWPSGRWDSWWVRSVAVLSGSGWFGVGALFTAAALTSGGARLGLLIAGAAVGLTTSVGRWLVRDRWETRQVARRPEA